MKFSSSTYSSLYLVSKLNKISIVVKFSDFILPQNMHVFVATFKSYGKILIIIALQYNTILIYRTEIYSTVCSVNIFIHINSNAVLFLFYFIITKYYNFFTNWWIKKCK